MSHNLTVMSGGMGMRLEPIAPVPRSAPADDPTFGADFEPLAILAMAASTRLDDPRCERERIVHLTVVLEATRETCRALHAWMAQYQSEYRGSHTAWDLGVTSGHLRITLARYEQTVYEACHRLRGLIPEL